MAGQASSPQKVTPTKATKSEDRPLRIITYNCKNMDTALYAFNNLSKRNDIFLIQEHWYFDCQLTKLDHVCEAFNSCGKAVDTGNPILPVQMPRGYGGVAILWRKDIDHLVTTLPDGTNRIQCIEISCKDPLIIVSVYMPCRDSGTMLRTLQTVYRNSMKSTKNTQQRIQ